jgi:hypothetical protein
MISSFALLVLVPMKLEAYIDSYMKEAKWISSGFLPTFEEYLDNGKVSFGYRIGTLQPILMLGIPFPHHILQELDFPSRLNDLSSSVLRLKGDIHSYQVLPITFSIKSEEFFLSILCSDLEFDK